MEYNRDLVYSLCVGFLVLLLTRIRFKAAMKIFYVINGTKKRIGLDVFKTRNIVIFDCSLNFGKVYISHSCFTYIAYLQPQTSGDEEEKKRY